MIEKQVRNLYKKLKKRMAAALESDAFYSDFMNLIQSGARSFTQHNVEVVKTIDEKWVQAIETAIPHITRIINNPRSFLKTEESVMAVELARKITSNSIKHLAANTHFISNIDERGNIIPAKILASYNDQSLDIYENRFVMTLLNKLFSFVDRRYFLIGEKAGNEFTSELNIKGKFAQNDERTNYDIKINIEQGPNYFKDKDTPDLFTRLEEIRMYLNGFRSSHFVRALSKCNPVRAPIAKTNLLTKNPEYAACLELYVFIENYTKAGYSVEVIDSNPVPTQDFLDESNVVMMFYYLLLKNNMEIFMDEKEGQFRKKRTYDPKLVEKYDTKVADVEDIKDQKTLLMALQLGQTRKVAEKIRLALLSALDTEDARKERRREDDREREKQVMSVIRGAIATERTRRGRKKTDDSQQENVLEALRRGVGAVEERKREEAQTEKRRKYRDAIENAIEEEEEKKVRTPATTGEYLDFDDLLSAEAGVFEEDEGDSETDTADYAAIMAEAGAALNEDVEDDIEEELDEDAGDVEDAGEDDDAEFSDDEDEEDGDEPASSFGVFGEEPDEDEDGDGEGKQAEQMDRMRDWLKKRK